MAPYGGNKSGVGDALSREPQKPQINIQTGRHYQQPEAKNVRGEKRQKMAGSTHQWQKYAEAECRRCCRAVASRHRYRSHTGPSETGEPAAFRRFWSDHKAVDRASNFGVVTQVIFVLLRPQTRLRDLDTIRQRLSTARVSRDTASTRSIRFTEPLLRINSTGHEHVLVPSTRLFRLEIVGMIAGDRKKPPRDDDHRSAVAYSLFRSPLTNTPDDPSDPLPPK